MINISYGFLSIKGVKIGHAHDFNAVTGCTVILFENSAIYGVYLTGSASSTRQVPLQSIDHVVPFANAILLTGGSAYGLDAGGGVLKFLEERGVGIKIGKMFVPSVLTAAIYDLAIGDGKIRPDEKMGYSSCLNAKGGKVKEGSVGAGTGATVGKVLGIEKATKGGIGISEIKDESGLIVCAISVVNSFGDIFDIETGKFLAGVREKSDDEKFSPSEYFILKDALKERTINYGENTTITVVITNATLNRITARKVSQMVASSHSKCIRPSGTLFDGDIIFTAGTGEILSELHKIAILAQLATSHSIKRAVIMADSLGGVFSLKEGK